MKKRHNSKKIFASDQAGMALVVTLLALVLITAMVVEFSYAVYTGTNNLYNWRDSQRLSIMARSGVTVSSHFLTQALRREKYSYPGSMEMPVENPFEDFIGIITVRIEDENSKFNINSLVYQNGNLNESAYNSFKRLLRILSLEEKIADRVADWIDNDSEARLQDSEVKVRNNTLATVDELLMIRGIKKSDYDALLPYITVYGTRDLLMININGAEKPVLQCLSDDISDELAQRIVDYREGAPFEEINQLQKIAGFTSMLYNPISSMITVKGRFFSITSTASSDGVKRIIETVLDTELSPVRIEYWKEY
jgi:general secretion pathway protein K